LHPYQLEWQELGRRTTTNPQCPRYDLRNGRCRICQAIRW